MGIKYLFKAFDQKAGLLAFDELFKKLDMDEDKTDISNYKRLDRTALWSALGHDKKRTAEGLNLVLLDKVGSPRLQSTPVPLIKSRLEALSDFKG
jgi:3-dehydroquinate synthetase